jgi:hypothetical protein
MGRAQMFLFTGALISVLISGMSFRASVDDDLGAKISAAKTAADHELIAAEFEKEARAFEAQAVRHANLARYYDVDAYPLNRKEQSKKHCDAMNVRLLESAHEGEALAAIHREMAAGAPKQ